MSIGFVGKFQAWTENTAFLTQKATTSEPMKRTIKVDAVNALGFSALMKAAVQGHINCVSTLLEYGANDAIKDSGKGLCAQGWAQYCNRNQVVVQLSQFPREQVGNIFLIGWHPMDSEWKKYRDENNPFNSKSSSINIKI